MNRTFSEQKNKAAPWWLPFLRCAKQQLLRCRFLARSPCTRLVSRCRRLGSQQLALFHHHHERIGGIGGRLALELEIIRSVFRHQARWNLLFKLQRDVWLVGVDIIRTAGDHELLGLCSDDLSYHLYGFTLDRIPNHVLIGLAAVGEHELPGSEVHFVRRGLGHHVVRLIGRRRRRRNRNLGSTGFGGVDYVVPTVVSLVILHVLRACVLLDSGLAGR